MLMKRKRRLRLTLILSLIFTAVIYIAGIYTGMYLQDDLEGTFSQDLQLLRAELDTSAVDIKNLELQQLVVDNFAGEDVCRFKETHLLQLNERLSSYWAQLPTRLEDIDTQDPKNQATVREYTRLSLRFWTLAAAYHQECSPAIILPLLYFFEQDCQNCQRQAQEFDIFKEDMSKDNKTVLVFAIDYSFPDDTVQLFKKYYNITQAPSVILPNYKHIDRVVTAQELQKYFE